MLRAASVACAGTAALTLSACDTPVAARDPAVAVAVGAPTVLRAGDEGRAIGGTLPITVTNVGTVAVRFEPCGTALERHASGVWQPAGSIICMLGTRSSQVIAPGERRTQDFPFSARFDTLTANGRTVPAAANFRVRVWLWVDETPLPEGARTSSPFRLPVE